MRRRDRLGEALDAADVVVKKRALDAGHGVAGAALDRVVDVHEGPETKVRGAPRGCVGINR